METKRLKQMIVLRIKNLIRALLGVMTTFLPGINAKGSYLYCNLINHRSSGGPSRFLYNLLSSIHKEKKIKVSNFSLKNCKSALVLSNSWGDSFTSLCSINSTKSVLRVDGFYVPDDTYEKSTLHSNDFHQWLNNRLSRELQRFDHIIYQSQFSKNMCDKYLYTRKSRFSIIYNGTDTSHFIPCNDRSNPEKLRIAILGKHYPKHLNLSIDILKKVIKQLNTELIIIGSMRDGSEGVETYIQDQELPDSLQYNIRCKGTVSLENLPLILGSADILLHSKIGDCCPNAVIEAMSCGLPVVCPSWGGTSELVGDAGVSVDGPPWRADEGLIEGMAQGVIDIASDLSSYKVKARERALNNFNIENVAKQYLSVLGY